MQIYSTKRKELTDAGVLRGLAAVFWTVQGDVAAKVDEDTGLCCGGGARAVQEKREEEDDRRGRMEKTRGSGYL